MISDIIAITGVNPEPWAVGPAHVVRKAGKVRGAIAPNSKLVDYQNALRESLEEFAAESGYTIPKPGTKLAMRIFFWRRIEKAVSASGKTMSSNYADLTNMVKAAEDAMQDVLFFNDRDNVSISATIVEQGEATSPSIVIMLAEEKEKESMMEIEEHYFTNLRDKIIEAATPSDDAYSDRMSW